METNLALPAFYHFARGRREPINSIAVLPLVNASGDPNMEYLTDGIAESLINSISQLPNLKVMSRNTTFRYKGNEQDWQPQTDWRPNCDQRVSG